jgi:hypothetical protein
VKLIDDSEEVLSSSHEKDFQDTPAVLGHSLICK